MSSYSPLEEAFQRAIDSAKARWTPKQIEQAQAILSDLAELAHAKLVGSDVDSELREAVATIANVVAKEEALMKHLMLDAITGAIGKVLRSALFPV